MTSRVTIGAASATILMLSTVAFAQQSQFGSAQEARAMLSKAVAAVKTDKSKALETFNKGEGGFQDRDLYPFCSSASDGTFVAVGTNVRQLLGTDVRFLKDATGKAYGLELYDAAQKPEGEITEVSYMFVRPGGDKTPVPKVTFVTRVGDLGCGVSYYK